MSPSFASFADELAKIASSNVFKRMMKPVKFKILHRKVKFKRVHKPWKRPKGKVQK